MSRSIMDAVIAAAVSEKQNKLMQLIEMSDFYLNLRHDQYLILSSTGEHTVVSEAESGCVGFYKGEVVIADDETENPEKMIFEIRGLLDGVEWSPATLDAIATILRAGGHPIRDIGEAQRDFERDGGALDENNLPVEDTSPAPITPAPMTFAPLSSLVQVERSVGEILVLPRFGSDKQPITVCPPSMLLAFVGAQANGLITPDKMSDYLVEAFDMGFCEKFNLEAATYAWRLPSGEIVHQHST